MERIKGSVVARGKGEGGMNHQHRGFLRQSKYSVQYYDDGYRSL